MDASETNLKLTFREMGHEDLDVVVQNETRSYAYPWSREIFADCLRSGYDCRIATYEHSIVGHSVLSAAAGESHLLNVCIKRDQQGKGLGRILVQHMLHRARILGADVLFLEVRPTNLVAQRLYASLGFREIGVHENYYPSSAGREDARVLALDLGDLDVAD
jgi:ribosomal-protein-alanine N-acetyltransferase